METFSFDSIEKTGIAHAICTPKGIGNWAMNDPDSLVNFTLLGDEFGISPDRMVRTDQKHTADVRVITASDAGEGVVRPVTRTECDGIMTDVPGLMLCTVEADCTPVYLLDPVNRAVAMLHSGWRGTAARITTNAIRLMEETYGTCASDIIAAIGPCICRDCYEVSGDLIPPFRESFGEETADSFFTTKENGKYLLDLNAAVRKTLELSGVLPENIEISGYCTCHSGMFYSWRGDGDPSVRMLTAIWLR